MIIEIFEHIFPESTDRSAVESWVNGEAKPNMAEAAYGLIRWCWVDAAEQPSTLISIGEHESPERLKHVWQTKDMVAARDQFYSLFPEAKVSRRILRVIEE